MRKSTGSPIFPDFPGSRVSKPLVKRNEESGYEVGKQHLHACYDSKPEFWEALLKKSKIPMSVYLYTGRRKEGGKTYH